MWVYYGDAGRVEGDDATRTATTYDAVLDLARYVAP